MRYEEQHRGDTTLTLTTQPLTQTTPKSYWHTLRQAVHHLFVALAGAYGLSVAGFLLLRWLVGESWPMIALFNSLLHLLLLPALVLLPLAVLLRRRTLVILLLPTLLFFVLSYGVVFVPRPVQAAADDFRLMTYNLKAQFRDLDAALAVIRDSDADVIALQEVTVEMAARIEAELIEVYPYQALQAQSYDQVLGQAVLSRYPVLEDEYWRLNLSAQRVALDKDGQAVTLYNVHPMMPIQPRGFIMRSEDIGDILARAAGDTGPVLLAGDFNMSDQSDDYRQVAALYGDAYRAAGWGMGFTFPADLPFFGGGMDQPPAVVRHFPPLVRLDYVFHSDHFAPLMAHVLTNPGGSDHLPVLVTLAFNQGPL